MTVIKMSVDGMTVDGMARHHERILFAAQRKFYNIDYF